MKPAYYSLVLSLFSVVSCNPIAPRRRPCPKGVHIIAARGSQEDAGPGRIGELAQHIISRVPDSDIRSVNYPAKFDDDESYAHSEHQGTLAMTRLVRNYVEMCRHSKVVLLGFSQGAQVVGDVLCGSSSDMTPKTDPLDASYKTSGKAFVYHSGNTFLT